MTDDAGHDRVLPPAVIEKRIDLASDRFEEAWKTGAEPHIEAFLEGWKEPERTTLLQELVVLDLEYRWRQAAERHGARGEVSPHIVCGSNGKSATPHDLPAFPLLEDYVRKYPEFGPIDRLPDELPVLEYEIRCRWGLRPNHEEYLKRFGHRISELIRRLNESHGRQHIRKTPASTNDIKSTLTLPQSASICTRCPYCHHLIDLPDDVSTETFRCQICRHTIDLVGGTSTRPRNVDARRLAHFELVEELGSGGFGVVWKARDVRLDRTVALKIPRDNRLGTEDIEKFLREARTAAQLKHPNIVRIHEVGREDDSFYIVSDYIEGLPLDQWLANQPMTPREAAELCRELATALQYAHAEGIIHRDLKPSNIMVDPHGRPHIMDFGLAKREVGEITMTLDGAILGTPAYMSPEQARGKGHEADRRSDVYSLGVILFELLTGELPFRGERQMLMVQILNDEPPSPRQLNNHVPRDLETICLKCLEKDPDRRYRTAGELADDLQRFLNSQPIKARPLSRPLIALRWMRRHPKTVTLVSTIVVSLAVITGLLSVHNVRLTELNTELTTALDLASESQQRAKVSDARTREHLYAADMQLAQIALKSHDLDTADTLLKRHRPSREVKDLRSFEWHVLRCRTELASRVLVAEGRPLNVTCFSPDGAQIAAAGHAGTVDLYDLKTGARRAFFHLDVGSIQHLSFAPSGQSLAVSAADGDRVVIDVSSGRRLLKIDSQPSEPGHLLYSADGERLYSCGGEPNVRIWDASTGAAAGELSGAPAPLTAIAVAPQDTRLVAGCADGSICVWNSTDGTLLRTLESGSAPVKSVAISFDGAFIAAANLEPFIKIWECESGELIVNRRRVDIVDSVAFVPAQPRLAVGYLSGVVGVLRVRDFLPRADRKPASSDDYGRREWRAHQGRAKSVAASADGRIIASAGSDGRLVLTEPGSSVRVRRRLSDTGIWDLAFAPEHHLLVVAKNRELYRVDFIRNERVGTIAQDDRLWSRVAVSPDGTLIAAGGLAGDVWVWNRSKLHDSERQIGRLPEKITAMAFSPDSRLLAVSGTSPDSSVYVIDVERAEVLAEVPAPECRVIAFSADSNELWVVFDPKDPNSQPRNDILVWSVSQRRINQAIPGLRDEIHSIAVSPKGDAIASVGDDLVVRLWNPKSKQLSRSLKGHRLSIRCAAFSSDGRTLATSDDGGNLRLWSVSTGQFLFELSHRRRPTKIAFSDDSRCLAVLLNNGSIVIFDTTRADDDTPLALSSNGRSSNVVGREGEVPIIAP